MFACSAFQRDYCTCVPKESAADHYKTLVDNFYAQYAPEKREDFMTNKIDKFAVNTGTPKKPQFTYVGQNIFCCCWFFCFGFQ